MGDEKRRDAAAAKHEREQAETGARITACGMTGMGLFAGPEITSALLELPEGSPPYVKAVGACLVIGATMAYMARRGELP